MKSRYPNQDSIIFVSSPQEDTASSPQTFNMAEEPAQTALKMTTGGWELEVSVNMEKVPLKVYGETREERQTVCWIASEAGKVRSTP